jgi:hypothetical protein
MDVQLSVASVLARSLSLPVSLRQQDNAWLAYRSIPNLATPFYSPPSFGYVDARSSTQPDGFELPEYWLYSLLAAYA